MYYLSKETEILTVFPLRKIARETICVNFMNRLKHKYKLCTKWRDCNFKPESKYTRVETLIVATIYLQLIQNRYMFRSFTVLQCSHQHCVQHVASDVEVVGYL